MVPTPTPKAKKSNAEAHRENPEGTKEEEEDPLPPVTGNSGSGGDGGGGGGGDSPAPGASGSMSSVGVSKKAVRAAFIIGAVLIGGYVVYHYFLKDGVTYTPADRQRRRRGGDDDIHEEANGRAPEEAEPDVLANYDPNDPLSADEKALKVVFPEKWKRQQGA